MFTSYHSLSLHPCARDGSSRCVACATRPPTCIARLGQIVHRMHRVVTSGAAFIDTIHATATDPYTKRGMTVEIIAGMLRLISHCQPNDADARDAMNAILHGAGHNPCLKPMERQTIIDAIKKRARARDSASGDRVPTLNWRAQTCTGFPKYITSSRWSLINNPDTPEDVVYDLLADTSAMIGLCNPDCDTITAMIGIVDTSAGAKARCQRITRDNFWDHVQKLLLKFVFVRRSLDKLGPQMYAGYVAQFPLSAKVFAAMYPVCYTNSGGPAGCPRDILKNIAEFAAGVQMPLHLWETQLCPPTTIDMQLGKAASYIERPVYLSPTAANYNYPCIACASMPPNTRPAWCHSCGGYDWHYDGTQWHHRGRCGGPQVRCPNGPGNHRAIFDCKAKLDNILSHFCGGPQERRCDGTQMHRSSCVAYPFGDYGPWCASSEMRLDGWRYDGTQWHHPSKPATLFATFVKDFHPSMSVVQMVANLSPSAGSPLLRPDHRHGPTAADDSRACAACKRDVAPHASDHRARRITGKRAASPHASDHRTKRMHDGALCASDHRPKRWREDTLTSTTAPNLTKRARMDARAHDVGNGCSEDASPTCSHDDNGRPNPYTVAHQQQAAAPPFPGIGVQPPIHYLGQSISTQKRADVCGDAVAETWVVRRRTYPGRKPLFPKKKQFRTGKAPKATWSKVIKYCQDEEARTPR